MGMRLPAYNAPAKKSIEISLPWHSSTIPIADMNHDIVRGKLNKSLKPQNPSKPWSSKDFFGGSGYYVHNTQGYLAKPDSLVVPSRPPPAERTAEDQPFFHVPRNPEDPRTRVDISSGSASLTASQLIDQEAMSRKSAAAASTALSLAEFIDNYPGMPDGARAAMLLLKLDIVSFLHYAWREVHNKMLLRRSIALDCLERTLPPIDEDQNLALLMLPSREPRYLEGSWPSYRKRTRSVLQPSLCSLSQQRPLHLTPHIPVSDEVGVLRIRRALRDLADMAGDRAGRPLPPRLREERNNRGASRFPRFLFKRIPGTESFRRVASSYRSKEQA